MTNGNKTVPHEKKKRSYHRKLSPETATLNEIVKLFGQESKIDQNLFPRYLKRVKELASQVGEQNALLFVQNLDANFKESPTLCQLVIWYSMSKHLSQVFKKIDTTDHNTFFVIQSHLWNIPDKNFQAIFSQPITNK